MRKLRNILLILLSVFLIVVLAGILLARIFEQEVTTYIIKELNKHIKTEIDVSDVIGIVNIILGTGTGPPD